MSYGDYSYGEISYGEVLEADTGEVIAEFLSVAETLLPNWTSNPTVVNSLEVEDLPVIHQYGTVLDACEVDDDPVGTLITFLGDVIGVNDSILTGHIDSRTIGENFILNDLFGYLEYLSDDFEITLTSDGRFRIDGYIYETPVIIDSVRVSWFEIFSDVFSLSDLPEYKILGSIIESIISSDLLVSQADHKVLAVENFETGDTLYISFPVSVLDAAEIGDATTITREQIVALLENLTADGTLTSVGSFLVNQTEIVNLIDIIGTGAFEALIDALTASDSLSVRLVMSLGFVDAMEVSEAASEYVAGFLEAVEDFVLNDANSTQTDGVTGITEQINISHFFDPVNMQAWVMNPENYAVWNYTFGFTESARFGNDFLMADDTGLYLLGGTTDAGENIVSVITTAGMNFGSQSLKQVPAVLLGTNGTDLVLKVSIDGETTARYEIGCLPENLETKRIKLGKGLIGYNWQFTLIADNNSKFDLDSFEFYPIVFKRKHNG